MLFALPIPPGGFRMTEHTLESALAAYRQTGTEADRNQAISAIAEFVYENDRLYRLPRVSDDLRGDFLLWMYPRFGRIVDRFDPERASIVTYLKSILCLALKSFARVELARQHNEGAFEFEAATEAAATGDEYGTEVAESEAPRYPQPTGCGPRTRARKDLRTRKVLLLLYKSLPFIDDTLVSRVARYTGISAQRIWGTIEALNHRCAEKTDRLAQLALLRNSYYVRAHRNLCQLREVEPGTARYEALERQYAYYTRRLASIRKAVSRVSPIPSNRALARLFGMSRTTVDATLASALRDGYAGFL